MYCFSFFQRILKYTCTVCNDMMIVIAFRPVKDFNCMETKVSRQAKFYVDQSPKKCGELKLLQEDSELHGLGSIMEAKVKSFRHKIFFNEDKRRRTIFQCTAHVSICTFTNWLFPMSYQEQFFEKNTDY